MASAPRLRSSLERASGASEVRVDLRSVAFMDSSGLRALEVSGLIDLFEVSDA